MTCRHVVQAKPERQPEHRKGKHTVDQVTTDTGSKKVISGPDRKHSSWTAAKGFESIFEKQSSATDRL